MTGRRLRRDEEADRHLLAALTEEQPAPHTRHHPAAWWPVSHHDPNTDPRPDLDDQPDPWETQR